MNQKKLFPAVCLTILLIFISLSQIYAQSPKPIIAGVINGKALSLPQPVYSGDLLEAGVPGTIDVRVLIDEKGNVISAETTRGLENSLLRKACETAALQAKFSPTTLSGQPVKVSGVIVYKFTGGRKNEARLKVLAVSTLLGMLRSGATQNEAFDNMLNESDLLDTKTPELAEFTDELAPLVNFKGGSVSQRIELIDQSAALISAKLNESDKWQFKLGNHFGELMGTFFRFQIDSGETPDISKLDKKAVKEHIAGIKSLINSAPSDFPADVKEKLANLVSTEERRTYADLKDFFDFSENLLAVLNAISPNPTK